MCTQQQNENKMNNYLQRLEIIENNANRVYNQHQALCPLYNLLQLIPQIQKNSKNLHQISKNLQQLKNKIDNFELLVSQNSSNGILQSIQQNFRNNNHQIIVLKNDINKAQSHIKQNNKEIDLQLKDQSLHIQKDIDNRLQKNKKDINIMLDEFKKQIYKVMQSKINELDEKELFLIIQTELSSIKKALDIQIENISREIGMIKSEKQYFLDKKRAEFIRYTIGNRKPDIIEIGLIQQTIYQNQLKNNIQKATTKFIYQFSKITCKISYIYNNNNNIHLDYETQKIYHEDRFYNLVWQYQGFKKKFKQQINKLKERYQKIKIISKRQSISVNQKSLQQNIIILSTSMQDSIKRIQKIKQNCQSKLKEFLDNYKKQQKLH